MKGIFFSLILFSGSFLPFIGISKKPVSNLLTNTQIKEFPFRGKLINSFKNENNGLM
jgi:hypothetical protein